jgi:Na+(H+)/acetate symporter ActP
MKLYSDFAAHRSRQVLGDVLALVAVAAWIWLGVAVHGLVMQLTGFGKGMQEAGAGFRDTMTDVGDNLGGVPLIGSGIRGPFDSASSAGATLETAGRQQQVAVENLANGLGFGIALLPTLTILVFWLVPRIRFARRAARARALVAGGAGVDLLALRALSSQSLSALAAVDPDAMAAWRRGDDRVLRSLAALELRSSGVRLT